MDDPDLADGKLPVGRRKRLPAALAQRDWVGIAIELIVVTVGVLLAFQISQWAERQKQARDERQFLERLYRENREAIVELQQAIAIHKRAIAEFGAGLQAKNNPPLLAQYSARPQFGCFGAVLPSIGFNDTASQEIIASGKLSLVSDSELQSRLRDLVADQAVAEAQLDYARQTAARIMANIEAYYRSELPPNDKGRPTCHLNWTELVRDQRAVNSTVTAYRIHQLMLEARGDALEESEQVEQRLACVLHKPGCGKT